MCWKEGCNLVRLPAWLRVGSKVNHGLRAAGVVSEGRRRPLIDSAAVACRYAGLWRTQLLEVEITGRPKPLFGEGAGSGGRGLGAGSSTMRMAKFVVGDPGGALTEMTLPYDSR